MKLGKWFERGNKGDEGEGNKAPRVEGGDAKARILPEKDADKNEYEALIGGAGPLDDLKQIIRRNGIELIGSKQSFSADELCYVIDKIVAKEFSLTHATSTAGFRDKVEELAKKEGVL